MPPQPRLTVFWRPGCGPCIRLERALAAASVIYERRNVWEDDDAAAFVRSVNDGSETVPTVVLDGSVLTNPEPSDLIALLA